MTKPGHAGPVFAAIETWVVLGSANGSTNLGDEAMWEAVATALRRAAPGSRIVTDASEGWTPPLTDVAVLPHLVRTLRRGWWVPRRLLRSRLGRSFEAAISYPARDAYARRAAQRASVRPRPAQSTWKREVENSTAVIFGGAGAITDDYAAHGVYSWWLLVQWAVAARKPIAFIGQGIGPLLDPDARKFAAEMLSHAGLVSVRESRSAGTLLELCPDVNTHVTPDLAIALEPELRDREAAHVRHLAVDEGPFVAVSLHRRHSTSADQLATLARSLWELVDLCTAQGRRVVFVPNMSAGRYSDDRATADLLLRGAPSRLRDALHVQRDRLTPRVARALLGRAEALVTTRYHPLVFALAEGTPSVGIAYDDYYVQKLSGASRLFGVEGNVLPLGRDTPDLIGGALAAARSQRPRLVDAQRELAEALLLRFLSGVREA